MSLPGGSTSLAFPLAARDLGPSGTSYVCLDGELRLSDIARAARCPLKQARRAMDAFVLGNEGGRKEGESAVVKIGQSELPESGTVTRAALAKILAERLGLGVYALGRIDAKKREREMSAAQHPWKNEVHGRRIENADGGIEAVLTCSKCPDAERIAFRQLCDAAVMDKKFKQLGWQVDPAKCPTCVRSRKGTRRVNKPSAAAVQGQAKMYRLLQEHFNVEDGAYGPEWSDERIAKDCSLSLEFVAAIRDEAFGPLKEPPEIAKLNADLEALASLFEEQTNQFKAEIATMRARIAEARKRFGG